MLGSVLWNSGWLLISVEKAAWASERDRLESVGRLDGAAALTVSALSVRASGLSLQKFVQVLVTSDMLCSFPSINFHGAFVKFIPKQYIWIYS